MSQCPAVKQTLASGTQVQVLFQVNIYYYDQLEKEGKISVNNFFLQREDERSNVVDV